MQHRFHTIASQHEDSAAAVCGKVAAIRLAALLRGAIQISQRVADQRAGGIDPIPSPFEVMQHAFYAAHAYFKYDSASLLASACCTVSTPTKQRRSVQVAFRVKDQSGKRVAAIVRGTGKAIQHTLHARLSYLENRAEVERSAVSCCAIQITRQVTDQPSPRR